MELKMNFNTFIKLKDASKVESISGEILEYNLEDKELTGNFLVSGSYLKEDHTDSFTFKEELPFEVLFLEDDVDILDIDCVDLNYGIVCGRGLDVSFDLRIQYNVFENNKETVDERKVEVEEEYVEETNENVEIIKEEITKEIEQKLYDTIFTKEDNLPTEESIVSRISENKRTIKVVYYENDKDLERICKNNNVSINEVFKSNSNNDIDKYQRVILK